MKLITQRRRKKLLFGLTSYPTRKRRGEPDFIIVGAEKAGTTSLHDYINQHPSVIEGHRKEIQYFSRYFYRSWDWYRAHFPFHSRLHENICGEASPYYIFHPYAAERIHSTLPNIKIIMLLREPITRTVSQYYHEVAKQREELSLEEAIAAENERTAGEVEKMCTPTYLPFKHEHFSYVEKSNYVDQVQRYLSVFPRNQIMIIQSERFFRETAEVTRAVYEFLGIDGTFVPPNLEPANVSPRKKDQLVPQTRKRLETYFAVQNEKLYELIGERYDW
ncbi:MAG: sulfotransferase domain-containing protein [Spirochaetaceae bacterium]|nr:sulfotransferase domain-containing protein [Spirochaetaceae bacterium]MCF7949357.1 sulfotransferase domain-containing protein [Spirochaetia bacterium]